MIKQFVDILDSVDYHKLLDYSAGADIKWTYNPTTVGAQSRSETQGFMNQKDTDQFVCPVFNLGEVYDNFAFDFSQKIIAEVFYRLKIDDVYIGKIKINSLSNKLNVTVNDHNGLHQDSSDSLSYSIVYYLNESDGDTFIYPSNSLYTAENIKPERVTPKKNSCVLFNSDYWHASSNPIQAQRRLVLNILVKTQQPITASC